MTQTNAPDSGSPGERICLFPGEIGSGGIGMVMLALAEEMDRRGLQVDLVLAGRRDTEREAGRALPERVRVLHIAPRARYAALPFWRYLRRTRPAMVITARDYIHLTALLAHRLSGLGPTCQLVWSFHTHQESQRQDMSRLARTLDRRVLSLMHLADARVAVSSGIASDLAATSGLALEAFNIIDNPGWTPRRAREATLPCDHPWLAHRAPGDRDPKAPVALAIGRLVAQKDFPTLINAFAQWRMSQPGARLIVLGEGPERGALEAHIKSLGLEDAIDLAGHVAHPVSYLSRVDLFVMSSLWEGQPMALIEAVGCGCPIAATDCPTGPADILSGGLGVLAPTGNSRALADAMTRAINTPPPPAQRAATLARFGAERAADAYLSLPSRRIR